MMQRNMVLFLIAMLCATIFAKLSAPVPSCRDTVFTGKIKMTLSCDSGAMVYYTTNGTTPGRRSMFAPLGWKFEFDTSVILKAIAMKRTAPLDPKSTAFDSSDIVTQSYMKKLSIPKILSLSKTFKDSLAIKIKPPEKNVLIRYTLDGTVPGQTSAEYKATIMLKQTTTFRCIATKPGYKDSDILTIEFKKELN